MGHEGERSSVIWLFVVVLSRKLVKSFSIYSYNNPVWNVGLSNLKTEKSNYINLPSVGKTFVFRFIQSHILKLAFSHGSGVTT